VRTETQTRYSEIEKEVQKGSLAAGISLSLTSLNNGVYINTFLHQLLVRPQSSSQFRALLMMQKFLQRSPRLPFLLFNINASFSTQINCEANSSKSWLSSVPSEVKESQSIHKGPGSEYIRKWMITFKLVNASEKGRQ